MPDDRAEYGDGTPRTDGGGVTRSQQILDDHGVGQDDSTKTYSGTKRAFDAIERFAAEYVDDQMIISSRSLANAVDPDIRVQEIGKTLAAHLEDRTPDTFLDEFEVSKWSDAQPIKWTFKRTAGEADIRRSRRLQKTELVREISQETGAEGEHFRTVDRGGARWETTSLTLAWRQDVLEAVCASVDYTPQAIADQEGNDEDEMTRREWIDELTQAGATQVLERALEIDAEGVDTGWNKSTLRAIHEVLVEGRDPSEVRS